MSELTGGMALMIVLVLWFRVRHHREISERRRNRSSREW